MTAPERIWLTKHTSSTLGFHPMWESAAVKSKKQINVEYIRADIAEAAVVEAVKATRVTIEKIIQEG